MVFKRNYRLSEEERRRRDFKLGCITWIAAALVPVALWFLSKYCECN